MTTRGRGGVGAVSMGPGAVRGGQIDRLTHARYTLYEAGILGPTNGVPTFVSDGLVGQPFQADFTAADPGAGEVQFQMLPSWPRATAVRIRNATALAAVRGLGQATQAGLVAPNSTLAAGERIEFGFGGANPSRTAFVNVVPAIANGTRDVEMSFRAQVKNYQGFDVGNIVHFGWAPEATPATFEAHTSFAAFKLVKGASFEADIQLVTREASGSVTTVSTASEIQPNLAAGVYTELEVRISGVFGANLATFLINGTPVRTIPLTAFESGFYMPTLFLTAGANAFGGLAIGRLEIGPRDRMTR